MSCQWLPLCESAKNGRLCIDDLCRTGGETLCGFDMDEYERMAPEDPNVCPGCWSPDCRGDCERPE